MKIERYMFTVAQPVRVTTAPLDLDGARRRLQREHDRYQARFNGSCFFRSAGPCEGAVQLEPMPYPAGESYQAPMPMCHKHAKDYFDYNAAKLLLQNQTKPLA
jgi:hypothetical protein